MQLRWRTALLLALDADVSAPVCSSPPVTPHQLFTILCEPRPSALIPAANLEQVSRRTSSLVLGDRFIRMGSTGNFVKDREITVLVTGFGPFQDKFPVNPSFEIAKSLPELLPARTSSETAIRIIPYSQPIRVAYDDVRELIPKLHEAHAGSVDLVMHIGMASGRKFYCAERYGHRDGYGTFGLYDKHIALAYAINSQEQRSGWESPWTKRGKGAFWRLPFDNDKLA